MFETHLKGEASIFSKVEFSNVNIFNFPTFGRTYDITQQTKIEAPERQCSSAPKEEFGSCLQRFLQEKLNCRLPWQRQNQYENCTTEEQYAKFAELQFAMHRLDKEEEDTLKDFGCIPEFPRCKNQEWQLKVFYENDKKLAEQMMKVLFEGDLQENTAIYSFSSLQKGVRKKQIEFIQDQVNAFLFFSGNGVSGVFCLHFKQYDC